MIRLLYRLFPRQFNKLLFNQQHVNPELDFVFIDSEGRKYHRYHDDLQMPMVRKGAINQFMTELTTALTQKELSEYLKIMRASLQELIDKGIQSKPLATLGYMLNELEEREELHIHPELCFDLCACVYIREDEKDTDLYNWNIHAEKVDQFKKDSKSGLHDFFFLKGWTEYLPYSNSSPSELKAYVDSIKPQLEAQKRVRSNLIEQLDSLSKETDSSKTSSSSPSKEK